jgi:hypothetical protein
LRSRASHLQHWLSKFPRAIRQFLFITANISKKAVSETALMLSPQSRGELIQERSRIIMAVEVDHKASVSSLNRKINQLTRPETHPLVAGFLLSGLLAANVAPDREGGNKISLIGLCSLRTT